MRQWSINYYIETSQAAGAAFDAVRANGGLGEYYSESDTRAAGWVVVGDTRATSDLVGLSDADRVGGPADAAVVSRWFDTGVAPNGARGRKFSASDNHGFDLTFCAPKSVSLVRAFGTDVMQKAVADAHAVAVAEALAYLHAHAGYTRVHNKVTGKKDLQRLPGLVAVAYQHETSRAGDPHLHTHVTMPNKQARVDGKLAAIDSDSLWHEAKAAGVIYQATLRRALHHGLGIEWSPVNPATGMAELAGVSAATITAWSQRATQLREWAAENLVIVDAAPTQAQLAVAQKSTRPKKPESLSWPELRHQWATDARGFTINMREQDTVAAQRRAAATDNAGVLFDRRRLTEMAAGIDKAAFTRADLIEILGAQLPVDVDGDQRSVREQLEAAADAVGMRISAPREAHHREGNERYTIDLVLAEEVTLLRTVDATDERAVLPVQPGDVAGLSADQSRAVRSIAASPWLVCPVLAPAGAGKTHSLKALHQAARRDRRRVVVLAPTGRAVDGALNQGAGDAGYTVDKALRELSAGRLVWDARTIVVIDEAAQVGNGQLRDLLAATTAVGAKTVLVGDPYQLAPVRKRGGMFEQLCADLPWTQRLSEVWRMHDPEERAASLALRNGGPAPLRRAVEWYRRHDRLHCGDEIAMADDARRAYLADRDAGKDALLIADSWELCDQLNRRIHAVTVAADAPTVTGARGHQIAAGDLIVSRDNDNDIPVYEYRDGASTRSATAGQVRNGQRWEVLAVDTDRVRIAARRLDDNAQVVFDGDYLRQHVHHGYALTSQACQGATADTCTQLIKTTATRNTLYMGATRGRETNRILIYDKIGAEGDHEHDEPTPGVHVARRGNSHDAARLMRAITSRGERARTVHDVAANVAAEHLPQRVARFVAQRAAAVHRRRTDYQRWTSTALDRTLNQQQPVQKVLDLHRRHNQSRNTDHGHSLDI